MPDLAYYADKIAECLRLVESSDDPVYRDVYQAMADEFAQKYAALARRLAEQAAVVAPPSPLLSRVPSGRPGAPPEAVPLGEGTERVDRRR